MNILSLMLMVIEVDPNGGALIIIEVDPNGGALMMCMEVVDPNGGAPK